METIAALVTITLYKPMEPPIAIPVADFTEDLGYEKSLPEKRIASILGAHRDWWMFWPLTSTT